MANLRPPSEPDTRILSAADAGRGLRQWQRHPEAAVRLTGVLGDRLENLIRLFEVAAQEHADTRVVSLEKVVTALFGLRDLEAADPTANWRKFVQLLRTEFENLECPLDIEFHKGRGSLRDRGVWVSETLSESQRLTETISASAFLLPEPNDRYAEAVFVPPTLAVAAAGRIYPHAIGRFLARCPKAEQIERWPEPLRARVRSLGASLRPVFTVIRGPQLPLAGFWLEPTDRAGTWPEAILPREHEGPADAGRWFAAAWLAAAAETLRALTELGRNKGLPGLRGIINFPAGWTPDYADLSQFLREWPELVPLVTLCFGEPKPAMLVPLLKQVRRAWGDVPLAACGAGLESWCNDERVAAQPRTLELAEAEAARTLSELVPDLLRQRAAAASVPLLLVPPAENPDKARWNVWLAEPFAASSWKAGSLAVGEGTELKWDDLVALGAQGSGGRLALRSEGPEAEVPALLEHLRRSGWDWRTLDLPAPEVRWALEISCAAARLKLLVNLQGGVSSLTEPQVKALQDGPLVVLGQPIRPNDPWDLSPSRRPASVRDARRSDGKEPESGEKSWLREREGTPEWDDGPSRIRITWCPDRAALDRFLEGLQRADAMSDPLEAASGVGRQALYAASEWEDLAFQDEGDALTRLLAWAQGQGPRSAVILGEYGAGKTFLCRVFCAALTKARRRDPQAGPVPVYVDLRDLPLPTRQFEQAATALVVLRQALARLKTRDQDDAACHALREAAEAGLILLVLDGFDEIAARLDLHNRERLLRELLGLAGVRGRLLLSSRTHLFESRGEEDRQFGGQDSSANRDGRGEILRLYVQPFTEAQILGALEKRLGPSAASEALSFVEQIHNLPELARRPVLLDMIARSLDRIRAAATGGRVLGAADLYDAFIQEWLERDKTKSICGYAEKRAQMGRMAITLWREGAEQGIEAERLPQWLREQFTDIRYDERDLLTTNLRTANFLVRDAEGHFRFAHRSFWEYFLASGLLDELRRRMRVALDGPRLGPEVVAFLVSLALGLDSKNRQVAADTLVRILIADDSPEAATNALLVLAHWQRTSSETAPRSVQGAKLASARLEKADLRGLCLEAPDLAGADLTDARLDGACLNRAVLDDARLFRTSLVDAVLEGASVNRAVFDLTDATRTDFRRSQGQGIQLHGPRLVQCRWEEASWNPAFIGSPLVLGAAPTPLMGPDARRGHRRIGPPWVLRSTPVAAVAFSPDGRRLLSGSYDGTLRVWEAESGTCLRTLKGHEKGGMSVAFSPDGRRLLSGSSDGTLRVWEAESGTCLRTLKGHENWVMSVAFSPDGRRLLSGSYDGTLRVWEAESGTCLRTLKGHEKGGMSVAFSPDGRRLLSGSSDGTLRVWEAESGTCLRTLKGHEKGVMSVAFSPDGRRLLSGSSDGTLRVWEAESGTCLRTLKGHEKGVMSVAFSPDGRRLLSGSSDGTLRVWEAESGTCLRTLKGHEKGVMSVAFSPDGRRLLSGSFDGTLRVWEAESGTCLRTLKGHENGVMSVAFSPDGRRLLSGSSDGTLRVWEAESGTCLRTLKGHEEGGMSVAFSPDGRRLLSGSSDGTLRVWEAESGTCLRTLKGHEKGVMSVAFSPDGRRLLSGSYDGTLRVWEAESGTCLRTLKGHEKGGMSVAFSPDGRRLLSGSSDGTLRVWEAESGTCLRTLKGHEKGVMSVAFSPDGRRLLSGSFNGTLRVWEAESGTCLRTLKGHENWVMSVAFSPDGRRLLSGSSDGTLRVWEAESGTCLRTLKGHENWVRSVAFSPDGRRLLSGSSDGTLRGWEAESGDLLRVTTSSGVSVGPDGWPMDNGTPLEVLEGLFFPSEDGHSYSAREILEIRALALPLKPTPLRDWAENVRR